MQPALEKQLAAVSSLLYALQRKLRAEDEELSAAGIDTRIREWPPPIKELSELHPSADAARQLRQLRVAQLDAVLGVTEVLAGLREPANVTVSFAPDEGEAVERFWSAGAFGLIRDRLGLLERITREHDRLQQQVADGRTEEGQDAHEALLEGFELVRLGAQAMSGGDPEAALFHAIAAVSAALGTLQGELSAKLAEIVETNPHLDEQNARILAKASESVEATLKGQSNLAVATLLARAALRAAHVLIIGPLPDQGLSGTELAELIESSQPLEPLEPEVDDGTG